MAAMRIIDDWAVAVAALDRPSVTAARAAALAHPRGCGSTLIGLGPGPRVDLYWARLRQCDGNPRTRLQRQLLCRRLRSSRGHHRPACGVAEAKGLQGADLIRGIVVAYEVQVDLIKGIELNRHRIDHVGHLGPAIAAGIGAMLRLETETIFHAVNLAAHLSVSTRQTRKGRISSYKANAPGHVGQIGMLAVDRAMRGETSPEPVYEGDYGLIAILLDGPEGGASVPLPEPGEPPRSILETYPKEHSAGYHGQALIDLAFRMRERISDAGQIRDIEIRTKEKTHMVMGSGANDPEKWDPETSRETLDHSAMYIFAVALQDGKWDHEASYARERSTRPDTVELWRRIRTVHDPEWTREFREPEPLDKAHGARVVVTFSDGSQLEDELRVANAHPKGSSPWGVEDYHRKFTSLAAGSVLPDEAERFLDVVGNLPGRGAAKPVDLSIKARVSTGRERGNGLFPAEPALMEPA